MTQLLEKSTGGFYGQALGDAWVMPALLNLQDTWEPYGGGYIEEFLEGPAIHPVLLHQLKTGQVSGDVDTVGAMACAMSGAWKGLKSFRPDHLKMLQKANPWMDFEGLTVGLYQLALKRKK